MSQRHHHSSRHSAVFSMNYVISAEWFQHGRHSWVCELELFETWTRIAASNNFIISGRPFHNLLLYVLCFLELGGGVKILKYACCTRRNCCRETLERRWYLKFSEREHVNQTPFFSVHRSVRVREIDHNRIYIEICCIPSLVCMPRWANSKESRCSRLAVVTDILIWAQPSKNWVSKGHLDPAFWLPYFMELYRDPCPLWIRQVFLYIDFYFWQL